jgi:hypothetical protein
MSRRVRQLREARPLGWLVPRAAPGAARGRAFRTYRTNGPSIHAGFTCVRCSEWAHLGSNQGSHASNISTAARNLGGCRHILDVQCEQDPPQAMIPTSAVGTVWVEPAPASPARPGRQMTATSGVTVLSRNGLRRSEVARDKEPSQLHRWAWPALVTVRRCDLTRI